MTLTPEVLQPVPNRDFPWRSHQPPSCWRYNTFLCQLETEKVWNKWLIRKKLVCVSTVVEQSTHNCKIEGSNPANDLGNWKGLDLVTYKKKKWSSLAQWLNNRHKIVRSRVQILSMTRKTGKVRNKWLIRKKWSLLAQWLNNRHKIACSRVQILPMAIGQKKWQKGLMR